MDITEIRSAFLASAGVSEKVRDLRVSRISKLKNNAGYTELKFNNSILAVHLVPFSSFGEESIDLSIAPDHSSNLWPFFTTGLDYKYNFEGFITFSAWPGDNAPHTYVHLNRRGVIESVESGGILREEENGNKILPAPYIEEQILDKVMRYLNALPNFGISPPLVIMISLLGVKGFNFVTPQSYFRPNHIFIEEQDLLLPEVLIESYPTDINELSIVIKPAFDAMWNAAGYPNSNSYNAQGQWVKSR